VPAAPTDNLNFVLLEVARLIRSRFEERVAVAGVGVTPSEARVLAHLSLWGALRQNLLAERLGIAQMSVCGFVDRLEAAGLVRRIQDPCDRRAKQVHLTEAAGPVLAAIATIGTEVRRIARGDMSESDWIAFTTSALRVRDNLTTPVPFARTDPSKQRVT
jgi:MarR family transcriptional regulator, transcriptional regulator for hemolysin